MINIRILALQLLILPAILFGLTGCRMISQTLGMVGQTLGMVTSMAVRLAPAKLFFLCIPEETPIDTPNGPRPIELVRPGDKVIGFEGHAVRVLQIHAYAEDPTVKRFLHIEFENGAIVRLCDMHRIDGIRGKHVKPGDHIGEQTVKSIETFDGVERSYDLLTEDGGYQISGLPVNSMIEEMLKASRNGLKSIRN